VYVTCAGARAESIATQLCGALLLAFFWQQCGWLAHDFGHNQVFSSRAWNDVGILLVGNLYQGFSCEWWKNKHNTHHAIPNLLESEVNKHDGDPDIDTLPFLAWSTSMAKKVAPGGVEDSAFTRALLSMQSMLYFPILFFARITWAMQSAAFVFRFDAGLFANNERAVFEKMAQDTGSASRALKYEAVEKGLLIAHYIGCALLCLGCTSSLGVGLAHFVLAETVCGLLLAVAFGVGHNGMAIIETNGRPDFGRLQVSTTRNVEDDALGLTGWFMGGLHLQIEHHLYPAVPRHNLAKIRSRVEPLCKKFNVPYHSTSLWQGTREVLGHLSSVARTLNEFPAA
jgi:acyl-lipid Delta6-acetylenase / acyl-lipid (9-3)-desaturase